MPSSPAQGLVHCDAPVALISSQCRQSDAARRFAVWLSGSEGTGMIRDSIDGFTILSSGELNRPVRQRKQERGATVMTTCLAAN